MKWLLFFAVCQWAVLGQTQAQADPRIIGKEDLHFLEQLTKAVLDSARILPGQLVSPGYGKNNTGGTLVRPGGRDTYPSFWIRDYAMSLACGFISPAEQKHMLLLTASTQCDQTWITKGGSMVPFGAIADHIRVDNSQPIYFPGTYDYEEQGVKEYGMFPPYCDQFYFIRMAANYSRSTGDYGFLLKQVKGTRLVDRLEMAFRVPPADSDDQLVFTNESFRGVDFGFRDAITITGKLSFPSLLKYQAANELGEIFDHLGNKIKAANYRQIAGKIKKALPGVFLSTGGFLRASTGISAQRDVWATALGVYWGVLEGEDLLNACHRLAAAYHEGTLALRGNIRHILKVDDYDAETAWERTGVKKNTYQNGAYWGTATGWVAYAIAQVDPAGARQLVKEYIDDLRDTDFRKGVGFDGPLECFYPPEYKGGQVYLTTVACPYIVLRGMR